jgi:hypothetical protein
MKLTLTILLLLSPTIVFGQSLTDVAKKEKQRREQNKEQGKKTLVISEKELSPKQAAASDDAGDESGGATSTSAGPPMPERFEREQYDEEREYSEEDIPKTIPPDAPLEERLAIFEKMKGVFNAQVREIDQAMQENTERIRQLDAKIGATSALGGAGLPVAPQTGTGVVNQQMTGQESQTLIAERDRLQTMNAQMTQRKEQLKLDLQTKGRVAGIPPGYLRF